MQGEIVIIESPFKGRTPEEEIKNIEYAKKKRCAIRYIAGRRRLLASLLYPQMLDDT